MNKVKFLGLAHTFVTVGPSNIQQQTLSKRVNKEKQSICDEFLGLAHTLATMSPQSILQQTCKGMAILGKIKNTYIHTYIQCLVFCCYTVPVS